MNPKHLLIAGIFCLVGLALSAQRPDITFKSFEMRGSTLVIRTSDVSYRIVAYSDHCIETCILPRGEAYDPASHALQRPAVFPATCTETREAITFDTGVIRAEIQKSPFQLRYYKGDKFITAEGKGYVRLADQYEDESIEFLLEDDEILYGGGARALGMNRRGNRLQLYNRAHYGYETEAPLMNYCMPLVISSKKYALHFDNPQTGFLDLDSKGDGTLRYETIGGRKVYQVITGDNWNDLTTNLTQILGRQPLPPKWTFGNFASRFGYHSQSEVLNTVSAFIKDSIPLDAVVLDLYWFGKEIKGTMGNFEFFQDSFPNPRAMFSALGKSKIKPIFITEPFILTTSLKWDEAVEKGILAKDSLDNPFTYEFYFGNTGLIDIYNPVGKRWFWDQYRKLHDQGVKGFWGDLGEPEVHPRELLHATGSADEVHNIYGHDWARLVFEGYEKFYPEERPFILMRSGYSGSQRYGIIPWTGDVNRSWGGLRSQPEIALQMGLQGVAYMHSDLGGFAGDYDDPELYVRWLQYGVFQPVYRPHAQEEVAAEPVFKDPETKALAAEAIKLRYRMFPYNYTLAWQNHQTGAPFMRPLFTEDERPEMLTLEEVYFWGDDILVAPVLLQGQEEKEVLFPGNSNWYNWHTGEEHAGGTAVIESCSLENIPFYVRGGAFIPMSSQIWQTHQFDFDSLQVIYFFDPDAVKKESVVYNDNGKNKAFENGEFETLTFDGIVSSKCLLININGRSWNRGRSAFNMSVRNFLKSPRKIKLGKKKIPFNYNADTRQLDFSIEMDRNSDNIVTIYR